MDYFCTKNGKIPNKQHQTLRIMKSIFIFSFVLLMHVNASTFAQGTKLTLHLKNHAIKDVFNAIEKQTDYIFILSENTNAEINKRVDVDVNGLPISDILQTVTKDTNLKYDIYNKQIVIYSGNEKTVVRSLQQPTVPAEFKGVVKDTHGDPLVGVTIMEKDGQQGTTTDIDGNFTLKLNRQIDEVMCIFSYIGYKSKEIVLKKNKATTVVLEENIAEIGEVVITGMFTRKKESFTGSQTTVTREQLTQVGTKNVLASIQAFVPGMQIIDNNQMGSDPNNRPELNIRGRASFEGAANLPIFIVDGSRVPLDYIYDMDMNDIETVTVLKDASASAMYGAKASAGVIVITTKSLGGGKLRFNYSGTMRASTPDLSDYHLLNAEQKLEYERLAGVYKDQYSQEQQYKLDEQYAERFQRVRSGINTDWLSMPLRNGISQNHNLSVDGGDENARYNAGIRYGKDDGVMKGSNRERLSSFFKLSYNKDRVFYISNTATVVSVKSNDSPFGAFSLYGNLNPYDRPYGENGELLTTLSHDMRNPIYEASIGNYRSAEQFYIMNTTDLQAWIKPELRIDGSFSFIKHKDDNRSFESPLSKEQLKINDPELRGSLLDENFKSVQYSGKLMLSYNKNLTDKLYLSSTAGSNLEATSSDRAKYKSVGFFSDKLAHPSFAARYPVSGNPTGGDVIDRSIGFFVNLNTIYDNRYFFDVIYRYEGSSKFGKDKRFAPFWSAGLGWNVHNESFMKGLNIQTMKLRASTGYLGNVGFSPYQSMTTYIYGSNYNYIKGIGAVPMTIGNPALKWERTLNTNVGLDLTMFNNRWDLVIDAYIKKTDNLLLDVTKAPSIGVATARENIGAIENKGIEVQSRVIPFTNNDWHWALSLTYSYNRNKIKSISEALKNKNEENMNRTDVVAPLPLYEEGQSLTALKVVPSAGIDPATGKEIFIKRDGTYTFTYDAHDKVVFGDQAPYAIGTLSSFLTYKQLSLNFIFGYSLGGLIYNQTLATRVEGSDPRHNADIRVFNDRWKQPGDKAKYKDIADKTIPLQTSRFVEVENYLSLRTLSLAYEFKQEQIKMLKANRLRLELMTNDLFHLSTIKRERGLDYPYARSVELSVRVSF